MMLLMSIALLVGLAVAGVLIARLQDKPWIERGEAGTGSRATELPPPTVGLWVLLIMVTSLFALFTGAYLMRMGYGHGGLMGDWESVREPGLLWLNTIVLVLASVAMHKASSAAKTDNLFRRIERLRTSFTAGGLLTLLFLAGQLWAWLELRDTGLYSPASPAYAFYVLLTGAHAVHLVGGLVVWQKTASRVWQGFENADLVEVSKTRLSVQLCTTYWHYLLAVWLVLFVLLLLT